jgi:predicted nucleic acid-binding protein
MVVCDSSPLIHLSRIGRLRLLKDLFGKVEISSSVYREVVEEAKALGKPGVSPIEGAIGEGWIKVVEVEEKDAVSRLADGEHIQIEDAEVLHLAKTLSTSLVTSDGWLIKVARGVGVKTIWTTTLVLMAVKGGMMSREDGKTLLGEFVISGLYIRPDVYAAILRAMDEL